MRQARKVADSLGFWHSGWRKKRSPGTISVEYVEAKVYAEQELPDFVPGRNNFHFDSVLSGQKTHEAQAFHSMW